MTVVGCHQGDLALLGKANQLGQDLLLLGQAVVLYFNIKMILTEEGVKLFRVAHSLLIFSSEQKGRDLSRKAARQGDEPLVVLLQKLHIDSRLGIKALAKALRNQRDQILISDLVFTKKNQVVVLSLGTCGSLQAGARCHVNLTADDGTDPFFFTGAIECHGAVHDAMVGEGYGGVTALCRSFGNVGDATGTVQQTVFTMQMKMNEIRHAILLLIYSFCSIRRSVPWQ